MNNENCQYCNIKIPFVKDPDRIVFQWHLAGHPNQDKPEPSYIGGVNLGVDKTEQIREEFIKAVENDDVKRELTLGCYECGNEIDAEGVADWWLQKLSTLLEEQKQSLCEEVENLREDIYSPEDYTRKGFNEALDTVLSIIKK